MPLRATKPLLLVLEGAAVHRELHATACLTVDALLGRHHCAAPLLCVFFGSAFGAFGAFGAVGAGAIAIGSSPAHVSALWSATRVA